MRVYTVNADNSTVQ